LDLAAGVGGNKFAGEERERERVVVGREDGRREDDAESRLSSEVSPKLENN
jgi:hypothetical protein